MAERDPTLPQSADPELQADLVRLLQVQGPLGLLNVLDVVVPVVSMGQVVPLDVDVLQPSFRSTTVFANSVGSPVAGTVIVDTGQLASGVYNVAAVLTSAVTSADANMELQHRNAANAANLAVLLFMGSDGTKLFRQLTLPPMGYEIGPDERLRIVNTVALVGLASASLFVQARA